jgi:hypothetical protein
MERKERKINTTEYIRMIRDLPQKNKSYAFFGFSIIVTMLLVAFAIRPTITTITRINQEIKEKTRTNDLLEKKINSLSDLDKEYAPNKESFEELEMVFPAGDNFSLLLANIELITSRNGHSLSSVRFERYRGVEYDLGTKVLVPYIMTFSARGREANIINFLRELEDLPMYPVIESFSYSTQQDEDGLNAFTVGLRVYHIENANFYK